LLKIGESFVGHGFSPWAAKGSHDVTVPKSKRALGAVWELLFCVRAWLQPRHNRRKTNAALAAEARISQFSRSLLSPEAPTHQARDRRHM